MDSEHYNIDYTREQVDVILGVIQTCVRDGKFNIINTRDGNRVVVISFHKPNKPWKHLFR